MKNAKPILAVVLCLTIALTACTANWVKIALADLPVLVQMATQIASLVAVFGGTNPPTPNELATINNIGAQAQTDLQLIQTLYNAYEAQPNQTNMQKIVDAIQTADTNLQALLSAAHISNQQLQAQITTAVNLILSTLQSIQALIPTQAPTATAKGPRNVTPVPTPRELKARWNTQVCNGQTTCAVN